MTEIPNPNFKMSAGDDGGLGLRQWRQWQQIDHVGILNLVIV